MGKRTASHIIIYNINESNIIIEKLNAVSIDLNGAHGTNETIFSWFECKTNSNQKQNKYTKFFLSILQLSIEHNSNNVQHKRGNYPRYQTMREWIVRKTHKTNDKSASQKSMHTNHNQTVNTWLLNIFSDCFYFIFSYFLLQFSPSLFCIGDVLCRTMCIIIRFCVEWSVTHTAHNTNASRILSTEWHSLCWTNNIEKLRENASNNGKPVHILMR